MLAVVEKWVWGYFAVMHRHTSPTVSRARGVNVFLRPCRSCLRMHVDVPVVALKCVIVSDERALSFELSKLCLLQVIIVGCLVSS